MHQIERTSSDIYKAQKQQRKKIRAVKKSLRIMKNYFESDIDRERSEYVREYVKKSFRKTPEWEIRRARNWVESSGEKNRRKRARKEKAKKGVVEEQEVEQEEQEVEQKEHKEEQEVTIIEGETIVEL